MVYSKNEEEYEEHLRLELKKLQDHRLYVKLSKCEFWLKQVTFISHIILEQGISVDSRRVKIECTY
jgi:cell fate regulator YaaT (PSP1 superfamily)